jgi:hypothetical protein
MARFSGAWKTAGAGTTTLPMASLYATAAVRPRVVEVGVFNTTAIAFDVALRRATTVGGTHAGAASAELYEDDNSQAAVATLFDTDTGTAPTLTSGNLRVASLGAAIGSGVIWTFGGGKTPGLVIPNTTGDGIVIIGLASPQICTVHFVWDE